MFFSTKILELEISQPLSPIVALAHYRSAQILVRLYGVPLGCITLPINRGQITVSVLHQAILDQLGSPLARRCIPGLVSDPTADIPALLAHAWSTSPIGHSGSWPGISVAVCTRNRATELPLCLDGLRGLDYPGTLEILIIDNAPSDDATERLIRESYPNFRYIREDRPGLNWARNRAISASSGEIIAYTDDDVVVDHLWARALARVFAENPAVMAVTGLVSPYEIETPAQHAFEQYGGFGRGYQPRWFFVNLAAGELVTTNYIATGKFGTGANMAYRRMTFERAGAFDPALDVGTVTNGGGDLEMFFRVLKAGFVLAYEPQALVRHRHRRDDGRFQTQIANNGVGFYSYLVRCFQYLPEERFELVRKGIWWFWYWYLYRMLLSFVRPINTTRTLILAELRGALVGLTCYQRASRTAQQMAQFTDLSSTLVAPAQTAVDLRPESVAVRVVDLSQPLEILDDVSAYAQVRICVQRAGRLLGCCTVTNCYAPIGAERLRQHIADQLGTHILEEAGLDESTIARTVLDNMSLCPRPIVEVRSGLSASVLVSVVVMARGHTQAIEACLADLGRQQSEHVLEIIVVGQHLCLPAAAGAEVPVITHMIDPGSRSWREAGLAAAGGALVVFVEGDLRLPPNWIEELLAPLGDPAVAASVGCVLPARLDTRIAQLAARYDGPRSRGLAELGPTWLTEDGVGLPGWAGVPLGGEVMRVTALVGALDGRCGSALAATANEGEGSYLLYRLQREGHSLAYAPQAYAWRTHTDSLAELRTHARAICEGQVAWRLLALRLHHDARPIMDLIRRLPRHYLKRAFGQIRAVLRGGKREPIGLIAEELWGVVRGIITQLPLVCMSSRSTDR